MSECAFKFKHALFFVFLLIFSILSHRVYKSQSFAESSLQFNGTNDVQIADSSSLQVTNKMTLEAWIKPTQASGHKHITGKNYYELSIEPSGSGFLVKYEILINGIWRTISSSAFSFNQWYHVAGSYNGSVMRLFMDGNQVASKTTSGNITQSSNSFRIGAVKATNDLFVGFIDEVRMSNNARYTSNFTKPTSPFTPDSNTKGLWHLDEGTGSTTEDSSGNNNNGILVNNPVWLTDTPFFVPSNPSATVGQWSSVLNWPLVVVHMSLLYTGDILMWDGWEYPTSYARLWNPNTNVFTNVTLNNTGLFCSGHSSLADGEVVVMGGHAGSVIGIPDVHLFSPANNSWSRQPDMKYSRWYPSVTTLSNGNVVAVSGNIVSGSWADIPEIFHSDTNTISSIDSVQTSEVHGEDYPQGYLLPDGKLYVISPNNALGRVLDVDGQTWGDAGTLPIKNGASAVYRPGKIILTGGGSYGEASQTQTAVLDTTSSLLWRSLSPMQYPRFQHTMVVLADGTVLVVGGSTIVDKGSLTGTLPAELWDPATEKWTTMAAMHDPRMYHSTALLLPDGMVLVAGGGRFGSVPNYPTAEIYSPPYLFKGARPTITNAPTSIEYNQMFTVDTPDANVITGVSFIRLGSVTHTLNTDQRFLPLSFSKGTSQLTVISPINSNNAPPGYYMLFLVNSQGVPSTAKIIKIGSSSPPTPTPTSTPTPTPTPTGGATQTITFDDKAGQDQVLSGEYPTGVINWGSNNWWHSAPWHLFTTKSVTFNGSGINLASFTFIAPKKLIKLDAYNGGIQTTLKMQCTGNPDKSVTISSNQLTTITTDWSNTCTTVTFSSTNGWDTNFDNLTIQ